MKILATTAAAVTLAIGFGAMATLPAAATTAERALVRRRAGLRQPQPDQALLR
jgi:hypothetical protein